MKSVVALLLSVPPLALGADTSLSLCQAVTTYFFNTCTDTDGDGYVDAADSVAEMTGEVVIAVVNNCPGNGTWISDDECQWTRKLCVSCDASTGTTRIRVQTNNMPDGSGQMAPVGQAEIDEKNLDFEVNFNQAVVTGQNYETEATTQDEVDDALCSTRAMASAKINDDNDFESADGSDTTVGNGMVTITGIVSWGTSANDVDPWFPPAYWNGVAQEVESVDNCLVHAADGWLHHHSLSPAYWASDGSTCTAYQALAQYDDEVSVTTLMFEGEDGDSMDGHEDLQIVGIALDGHLVFGPYASSTVEVYDGTGLDMCNGVRYDDDADGTRDAYAYFMSKTFPYQMGCWGPANYPDYTPNCTTNAQSSYSTRPALFNALYGSSSTIGPKPTSQPTPAPSLEPTTETPAPTKDSGDPNVLIVQFDDALAAYFEDWGDYVNPPDFPDGYRYEAGDFDGLSDYLPNIDSVRKNGVSFTHAYTTSSSCAPTRFSVLTGRYPSRGVFNTARSASAYGSDVRTYVQVSWSKLDDFDSLYNAATIFSGQGYATAHIGKWHLTPSNEDGGSMEDDTYASQVTAVKARGFDYVDGLYTENINTCAGEDYCSTFTHNLDWMTTRAVEFMDEYSEVPFFLYFNPTVPHEPDLDDLMVDGLCADGESSCDRQDTVDGRLDSVPTVYDTLCFSEDCEMPSYTDLWSTAEDIATSSKLESACASAIWIDDSLGVMLAYLEEQSELENTIIVVTSDNGSSKRTLYETGVRAPLFVRWTRGGILDNVIISDLVSSIDLLPTLVDLALPDYGGYTDFDGVSWADLATGASSSLSRDSIIVEYGFDRAIIRDDSWKLISALDDSTCDETEDYPDCTSGDQLYYLNSDSTEQTSLTDDSSYSAILSELEDLIDAHDDDTIDGAPVSPTAQPTIAPTSCFEPDADSWTSPSGNGCDWVAQSPDTRCSIGGNSPASDYCLNACGTCPDDDDDSCASGGESCTSDDDCCDGYYCKSANGVCRTESSSSSSDSAGVHPLIITLVVLAVVVSCAMVFYLKNRKKVIQRKLNLNHRDESLVQLAVESKEIRITKA